MTIIIGIICMVIGIIFFIASHFYVSKIDAEAKKEYDRLHDEIIEQREEKAQLEEINLYYNQETALKKEELNTLMQQFKETSEQLALLDKLVAEVNAKKASLETQEQEALQRLLKMHELELNAQENTKTELLKVQQQYVEEIETAYNEVEQEYDNLIEHAQAAYDRFQDESLKQIELNAEKRSLELNERYLQQHQEIIESLEKEKEELEKIRATRTAAIEAIRKETEIRERQNFYCVKPTELELRDIARLEEIKGYLNNPRVLSMLIWSTFYQKPMTTLCNNILGTEQVTGIYKITNLQTNQCYIGQAVNIADRWKQHCKCGLGIDTPQGNKLYRAMSEFGVHNFSWELLEACPATELNEKESYYIELYQSKDYGYNSTKGTK